MDWSQDYNVFKEKRVNRNLFIAKSLLMCKRNRNIFSDHLEFGRYTGASDGKESANSAGDPDLITGSGRSTGGGNGNPLQYSCLENSMDRRGCPWGCKEWDTTKWLTLSLFFNYSQANLSIIFTTKILVKTMKFWCDNYDNKSRKEIHKWDKLTSLKESLLSKNMNQWQVVLKWCLKWLKRINIYLFNYIY